MSGTSLYGSVRTGWAIFIFFFNFLEENSAERLSYRGQNNPPAEMSAFV